MLFDLPLPEWYHGDALARGTSKHLETAWHAQKIAIFPLRSLDGRYSAGIPQQASLPPLHR
jgi:hypothetical protein